MKQKILHFTFRGEPFQVNQQGCINANNIGHFSATWRFLGGTRHHWAKSINVTVAEAFTDPSRLNGCLGWDCDHGTLRQWGGRYCGKLPRIRNAYVTDISAPTAGTSTT